MPAAPNLKPVEDTVPMVHGEIAIGEDLEFQRRWWRFERIVWIAFALIVLLDLLGVFGKGYFAKGHIHQGPVEVKFERVERLGTPSIMTIHFAPEAIHRGTVQLWVSESVVGDLGNRRIIPQPESSTVGNSGVSYIFPASGGRSSVLFALQPASPGVFRFALRVPGVNEIRSRVVVMP